MSLDEGGSGSRSGGAGANTQTWDGTLDEVLLGIFLWDALQFTIKRMYAGHAVPVYICAPSQLVHCSGMVTCIVNRPRTRAASAVTVPQWRVGTDPQDSAAPSQALDHATADQHFAPEKCTALCFLLTWRGSRLKIPRSLHLREQPVSQPPEMPQRQEDFQAITLVRAESVAPR